MTKYIAIIALFLAACGNATVDLPEVQNPEQPQQPVSGWNYGTTPGSTGTQARLTAGDLATPPSVVKVFVVTPSIPEYFDWDGFTHDMQPDGHYVPWFVRRLVVAADQPFNKVNLLLSEQENMHLAPTFRGGTLLEDNTGALVHTGSITWMPADDWAPSTEFAIDYVAVGYEGVLTSEVPLWWVELVIPQSMNLEQVTVEQDASVLPAE